MPRVDKGFFGGIGLKLAIALVAAVAVGVPFWRAKKVESHDRNQEPVAAAAAPRSTSAIKPPNKRGS